MPVRCVIVDDSHEFLRNASELLECEGIDVVGTVSTGAQACRTCRQLKPDVALVDIYLGTETGFDVARQLADQAGTGPPRVILISASVGHDTAEMLANSPAVSFLPKDDLSGATIRAILARLSSADSPHHCNSR
ncbi:MAG TPA: response regulator [Streptosporangiaceae bacterium]|nr:response regulator [Streptosporangiaceae bacterium]